MKVLMDPHKLHIVETGKVNFLEYVKFMRIHEDFPMIQIESPAVYIECQK